MKSRLGIGLILLSALGCNRPKPTSGATPSASGVATAGPTALPTFAPLGPPPKLERTEDGIPILPARVAAHEQSGAVRWLRPMAKTLQWTSSEANDGGRAFVGIAKDAPDVLVRDGEVQVGVLRGLGVAKDGCAAARDGEILLSGVVDSAELQKVNRLDGRTGKRTETLEPRREQAVFRIDRQGRVSRQVLPKTVATSDDCTLWMGDAGKYTLGTFGLTSWDGERFSEDRTFTRVRTTLGRHAGDAYCFRFCNAEEQAKTPPITQKLIDALGCPGSGDFVAYEDWVAGACNGKAVRWKKGGELEQLSGLPESKILNGTYYAVLAPSGALVVALDYAFRRYVVWPPGTKTATPERTLAVGDVLSRASPALIVRGLGGTVPESNTRAVLVGRDVGYGTGGSTLGYSELHRSEDAHRAQVARAREVMGKDELWVAHEAVLDPACGAHVRSPLGWEGMKIHDFSPPLLPKLSPLAVTRSPSCVKLDRVAALPGDPDLLLALSGGELWGAWLPEPLPLPAGSHFGRKIDERPVVQHPKPGPGWTKLGKADALTGEDAQPAPGVQATIPPGTWQAAGGALIRTGASEVLLTRLGAVTLPAGTKPMAVGTGDHFRAWGAIGAKLVDCAASCRVLDPGVAGEIVAVVPRTDTTLLLGYADGRVGVYELPATGGDVSAADPLVESLRALLKKRPNG